MQLYLVFVKFYTNFIFRIAEKLRRIYKLLKAETTVDIFSELGESFNPVKKNARRRLRKCIKTAFIGKNNLSWWRIQGLEVLVMPL